VACVTAVKRVAGKSVTTVEGLDPEVKARWTGSFTAAGASQCGFCTPGILLRLAALGRGSRPVTRPAIESALLAHLCRCTGWQTIVEAGCAALGLDHGANSETEPPTTATPTSTSTPTPIHTDRSSSDPLLAAWRAQIEGPTFQSSGPDVVLGGGGFADDTAPTGALVQLGATGSPAPSLAAARTETAKVQGRNSTVPLVHPVPVPPGDWALTLQTTWVEPAYLEPDASWCRPGGRPASPLANGGAFGGKRRSPVAGRAQLLADELQSPVRVLWSREDVVRHGPKRPPLALALRADGTGLVRVGTTPGSPDLTHLARRVEQMAPGVVVEEVEIAGPPVGPEIRGAIWAEVLAARHALPEGRRGADAAEYRTTKNAFVSTGHADVTVPGGGRAAVTVRTEGGPLGRGTVAVEVWAGAILHTVTLRSYIVGAVHQALGLVWSEGIAVDADGAPVDLTIRSFGIVAARDMPHVEVTMHEGDGWPVNASDAVLVATMAAAWKADGWALQWPTRRGGVAQRSRAMAASKHREENA
jgi:xanthine dehydrogenase small subunit